ncbi:MAG TPA: transglycosylase SLT domain-containing protein [Ideonella sp.]|nr:transglycosylase SLT domain-containing protein [Ideonella sp.]
MFPAPISRRVPARPRSLAGLAAAALLALCATASAPAAAQSADDTVRTARDAYGKRDKNRLASLRSAAVDSRHPLAPWVDYWELTNRIGDVQADEAAAFYARWPGSYVEDRFRNDWLLELGRRRDWANFSRDYPRFRMNDDREVACYALLTDLRAGKDVHEAGRAAWMAQRDGDDGCKLLAQALYDAKQLSNDDVWRRLRQAAETGRARAARDAASLLGEPVLKAVADVLDNPARYLATRASGLGTNRSELAALAIARMAASDPAAAARQLDDRWAAVLGREQAAWAWAVTAKQGALSLRPETLGWVRNAWNTQKRKLGEHPDWSDDTLGWLARASLRQGSGDERWALAMRAIDAMSPAERNDPTWLYWRARALMAVARPGDNGDEMRLEARTVLTGLSGQLNFYGQLAAEELGAPQPLPAGVATPAVNEREATRNHPGLQRALLLFGLGLRNEAVREWNFSTIGMSDRELLSTAQLACEREIWDRCINTSERSKAEVDMDQRFPTPLRKDVFSKAGDIGLDPAYVYGLIRQESRFIMDARSSVGASGLMQVMPATAQWTAKRLGMPYRADMITDRDTNLRIGTAYLKMVLDDLGGSQPMAAAAYNAGPGRPRRWREGPVLEPAIWAENIPISETRDYVKKVISNATYYAGLFAGKPASIKARLGAAIGPRDLLASTPAADLP